MDNIKVDIKRLTKTYKTLSGEIVAINDFAATVSENEFVCVVGPSGCGKSTLISIIGGVERPTAGMVLVNGQPVTGPSPDKGIVFQGYAAFPWMNVYNNVSYGPRVRRIDKRERLQITQHCLRLVGLEAFSHLYPKELSGGMKKRVDIARAYANKPSLLLMDEPFGSLDQQTKQEMQVELMRIWEQEKTTVIFVTHDLEEAIFLADRVIVMGHAPLSKHGEIRVPFPRPRTNDLRMSVNFQGLRTTTVEVMGDGCNDKHRP